MLLESSEILATPRTRLLLLIQVKPFHRPSLPHDLVGIANEAIDVGRSHCVEDLARLRPKSLKLGLPLGHRLGPPTFRAEEIHIIVLGGGEGIAAPEIVHLGQRNGQAAILLHLVIVLSSKFFEFGCRLATLIESTMRVVAVVSGNLRQPVDGQQLLRLVQSVPLQRPLREKRIWLGVTQASPGG